MKKAKVNKHKKLWLLVMSLISFRKELRRIPQELAQNFDVLHEKISKQKFRNRRKLSIVKFVLKTNSTQRNQSNETKEFLEQEKKFELQKAFPQTT